LSGAPMAERFEAAIYSDTSFTGGSLELGPYRLLNSLSWGQGVLGQALVLRAEYHLGAPEFDPATVRTDTSRYHGGSIDDELAALAALAMGARCRSGGTVRTWAIGDDPLGLPVQYDHARPELSPSRQRRGSVLPRLQQEKSLDAASALLTSYGRLSAQSAVALTRAASMYAQAVWVADSDPNLAWIQMVGAVEAAAVTWNPPKADNEMDRLDDAWPELADVLRGSSADLAKRAASLLAPQVRSQRRFLTFLQQYAPDAPNLRPDEYARVDWAEMGVYARKIYDYRSRALHRGEPFPHPMCETPRVDGGEVPAERPPGLSAWAYDASWLAEDTPMLLATFEYVARGALCNWWASLSPPRLPPGWC